MKYLFLIIILSFPILASHKTRSKLKRQARKHYLRIEPVRCLERGEMDIEPTQELPIGVQIVPLTAAILDTVTSPRAPLFIQVEEPDEDYIMLDAEDFE